MPCCTPTFLPTYGRVIPQAVASRWVLSHQRVHSQNRARSAAGLTFLPTCGRGVPPAAACRKTLAAGAGAGGAGARAASGPEGPQAQAQGMLSGVGKCWGGEGKEREGPLEQGGGQEVLILLCFEIRIAQQEAKLLCVSPCA